MAYTRVNWQDAPSTATPRNAENLNKMDEGIYNNSIKPTVTRSVLFQGRESGNITLSENANEFDKLEITIANNGDYYYKTQIIDTQYIGKFILSIEEYDAPSNGFTVRFSNYTCNNNQFNFDSGGFRSLNSGQELVGNYILVRKIVGIKHIDN